MEEAIRKALADMPEPDSGLSKREVEEIVNAAIGAIAEPQPGLTPAEAEQIARGVVASIDGQWYVFIVDENDLVRGLEWPSVYGLVLKWGLLWGCLLTLGWWLA